MHTHRGASARLRAISLGSVLAALVGQAQAESWGDFSQSRRRTRKTGGCGFLDCYDE
jgi:hypothetical protein